MRQELPTDPPANLTDAVERASAVPFPFIQVAELQADLLEHACLLERLP